MVRAVLVGQQGLHGSGVLEVFADLEALDGLEGVLEGVLE